MDTHAEGAVVGGGIAVRRAFRCAGPGGERIRVMRAFAMASMASIRLLSAGGTGTGAREGTGTGTGTGARKGTGTGTREGTREGAVESSTAWPAPAPTLVATVETIREVKITDYFGVGLQVKFVVSAMSMNNSILISQTR